MLQAITTSIRSSALGRVHRYCLEQDFADFPLVIDEPAKLFCTKKISVKTGICLPFVLYREGRRAGEVLDRALGLSSRIFIADFRQPERNLDYPSHLLFSLLTRIHAFGNHGYGDFMQAGGLEFFLYRTGRPVVFRQVLLGGAASLVLLLGDGR